MGWSVCHEDGINSGKCKIKEMKRKRKKKK
jgi:hypothetical protein